jgi:ABC-2 type transport system permease protein
MSALWRETVFALRSRTVVFALLALAVLAGAGVALGLQDVARQEAAIARMIALQETDAAAVKVFASEEAGSAAYYRFHATWDGPSPLAFAALGQRDVSPIMLRVRALAIEGQIYESEAGNPELSLPGRFDFAFVLVYLAPLILIALLHDAWSSEREAGRWASLQAMPRASWRVWGARITARSGLVMLVLLAPFLVGAALRGAGLAETTQFAVLIAALVAFWTLVCMIIARVGARSAVNAATLAALWFVITLIAPAGANLAVNAATPIPSGAALAREAREAVHDAWDLGRNATLARFYQSHPEWAKSGGIDRPFHWKWYFAFQQLGDEHVAAQSRAYRNGIEKREARAGLVSWALPPIAIQRALHRLARTDVNAQLAYQDRVRAFHERLRRFYYPYLFADRPFDRAAFDAAPQFE